MTRDQALQFATRAAETTWARMHTLFGSGIGEMPTIEINARLRTTAGMAYILEKPGRAQFCYKLLIEFPEHFAADTIPHELAHFVAYRVFGEQNHGKPWKWIMQQLGLPTTPYHSLLEQLAIRNAARGEGIPIPKYVTIRD